MLEQEAGGTNDAMRESSRCSVSMTKCDDLVSQLAREPFEDMNVKDDLYAHTPNKNKKKKK